MKLCAFRLVEAGVNGVVSSVEFEPPVRPLSLVAALLLWLEFLRRDFADGSNQLLETFAGDIDLAVLSCVGKAVMCAAVDTILCLEDEARRRVGEVVNGEIVGVLVVELIGLGLVEDVVTESVARDDGASGAEQNSKEAKRHVWGSASESPRLYGCLHWERSVF